MVYLIICGIITFAVVMWSIFANSSDIEALEDEHSEWIEHNDLE